MNDFLAYLRLILCYKHWKQLFTPIKCTIISPDKRSEEEVREEARLEEIINKRGNKEITDIARSILPPDIPVYKPTSESDITIQFCNILPKLGRKNMKKATK